MLRRARRAGRWAVVLVLALVGGLAVAVAEGGATGGSPAASAAPAAREPAPSCPAADSVQPIVNGGFEEPAFPDNTFRTLNHTSVPGWITLAADPRIELWSTPFRGVTAFEGRQFAEVATDQPNNVAQQLATTPGALLTWSLAHRGRDSSTVADVAGISAGPPEGPFTVLAEYSDTNVGWGAHSGVYRVPAGQTQTVFILFPVSTASPGEGGGNFVDDIRIGLAGCLTATKTVDTAGPVVPGDRLRYTVTTRNDGGASADSIVLTDAIPPGTSYVPDSLEVSGGAGAFDPPANRVEIQAGPLAPAAEVTVAFTVQVDDPASVSSIVNSADLSYQTSGSDPIVTWSNEVATAVSPSALAQLHVDASVNGSAIAGESVQFVITVANFGLATAHASELRGSLVGLPTPGTIRLSATRGACTVIGVAFSCAIGDVPPGVTEVFSADVTIPATLADGAGLLLSVEDSTITAQGSLLDDSARVSALVSAIADLGVTKTVVDASAALAVTTFHIEVANGGPSAATAIQLTDALPAGQTPASIPGGCVPSGTSVSCTTAELLPGDVVAFDLPVTTDRTQDQRNVASVTSATTDLDPANNSAALDLAAVTPVDLRVTIDPSSTTIDVADSAQFTIRVENPTAAPAAGATLTWRLGAGLTASSASSAVGAVDLAAAEWTLGTLAAGGSAELSLTVAATGSSAAGLPSSAATGPQAAAAATVRRSLVVSVTSSQPELAAADNVAQAAVFVQVPDALASTGGAFGVAFLAGLGLLIAGIVVDRRRMRPISSAPQHPSRR